MREVVNKGNFIIRRAFPGEFRQRRHRIEALARLTNKKEVTAYKYCEETLPFGSGSPSPLHVVCELIRYLVEADEREGCEVSFAREVAAYPLDFYEQLTGGHGRTVEEGDLSAKSNRLSKCVSDANYFRRMRELSEMSPGELKDYAENMLTAASLARELGIMADETRQNIEADFPGSPTQGERLAAKG